MAKKASKAKKAPTTVSKPKQASEDEISVLQSNPKVEIVEVRDESPVAVRALIPFYDLEAKCERGAGAEWEVSADRAELLNKLGIAIVL